MLTKLKNTQLRKQLFIHLDGLALSSTYNVFESAQFFKYISENEKFTLKDLLNIKKGNLGYINIGLRLLTSQGLLLKKHEYYSITNKGLQYLNCCKDFTFLVKDVNYLINIQNTLFTELDNTQIEHSINFLINHHFSTSEKIIEKNIYYNLIGIIVGPLLCAIGMSNLYMNIVNTKNISPLLVKIKSENTRHSILKLFLYLSWVNNENILSDVGYFFFRRCSAYGVTTSYLPLFNKLDELYFGNPKNILDNKIKYKETHVNRPMNVWGSGGAHSLYFKKIDLIIIELFNRPIDKQPLGIADMGCGDGTFLIHLHKLILNHTSRGEMVEEFPLIIVGGDFNQEALNVTSENLKNNNITGVLIQADISNPKIFSDNLKDNHNIDLNDMINVRSFLDHNRIYTAPRNVNNNRSIIGAFANRGLLIEPSFIVQNLIEHLTMWKPFCQKFGLLILELHTVDSKLVQKNIGKTLACAYDATHGYSDQYIVSLVDFMYAAKKSNFIIDNASKYRFPNDKMPTVSINYLIDASS